MNLQFPYGFSANGWTAQTDPATHIADMIEQLLLTSPGERVNRPTFGTGTAQLVFAGISDSLAAAQQQVIQASLQQWLSDLIKVQAVTVTAEDSTLSIVVQYIILQTQEQQTQQVSFGVTA
jgi:phage baseplate assembly protein W